MNKIITVVSFLFFLFILWVIYTANTGQDTVFLKFAYHTPGGDKLGHVFLFGFLTLGLNLAVRLKFLNLYFLRIYWGTLFVSVFVIIEELTQYYLPNRNFDYIDLFADAIGIIVFTAISYIIDKKGVLKE